MFLMFFCDHVQKENMVSNSVVIIQLLVIRVEFIPFIFTHLPILGNPHVNVRLQISYNCIPLHCHTMCVLGSTNNFVLHARNVCIWWALVPHDAPNFHVATMFDCLWMLIHALHILHLWQQNSLQILKNSSYYCCGRQQWQWTLQMMI